MEKIVAIFQTFFVWLYSQLSAPDIYIQLALLVVAFVVAWSLYRLFHKVLAQSIERLPFPERFKQALHNLQSLLILALTILLLFPIQVLSAQGVIALDFTIGSAAVSLLLAWIVVRVLVQFIQNNALRSLLVPVIWLIAALSILGVMEEVSAVLDAAGIDIGEQRISALTVTKGLMAVFLLTYFANLVSSLLENKVNRTQSFSNVSKVLVVKTIRISLITLAILVGVTTAGIDLSLLAVFSGALGLGIGFGLQKGISNLFSGFLLLLDKSIKPGDVIELQNGAFGWVAHMGGRFTEIVTRDNKSFLIPNEDFITQPVVNWSHGNSLIRIEVKFGVSYESDPRFVKQLVEKAACKPDRVVAHPAPVCHIVSFGDSSVDFSLRFWITDAQEGLTNIRSAVMLEIWDAFKANDINIPYPHREVFLHEKK
ncbi:MAG: mechanosensitive ion channel protein [Puniceicoccaceae bacterium MED-G30]|nr:MAG: mechanosensitive ion channel protein [Puniceicoccaceae bacterium MED-G30]|tara:strand:- start:4454 stop:5731 length:1278 start_codon:yes stop_codon:yes gene_type:complete